MLCHLSGSWCKQINPNPIKKLLFHAWFSVPWFMDQCKEVVDSFISVVLGSKSYHSLQFTISMSMSRLSSFHINSHPTSLSGLACWGKSVLRSSITLKRSKCEVWCVRNCCFSCRKYVSGLYVRELWSRCLIWHICKYVKIQCGSVLADQLRNQWKVSWSFRLRPGLSI